MAGAFAQHAESVAGAGLAVIPVRDKSPIVSGFNKWSGAPNSKTVANWAGKFPGADIGIVTGALSQVAVIDLDIADQLPRAIKAFGETQLIVRTRRGHHLYYRYSGQCGRKLAPQFRGGDLKACNGIIVVPPSTGKSFERGTWADLPALPELPISAPIFAPIQEGERNDSLYLHCLREAPYCDDLDALIDVARTFTCLPPLPDREVIKTARSAWDRERSGRNWIGHPPSSGQVVIDDALTERLLGASPRHAGDALILLVTLRAQHGARDRRGDRWPVAARAMARDNVLPWTEQRIRHALAVLLNARLLKLVKRGGTGEGDPHLFRFRSGQ